MFALQQAPIVVDVIKQPPVAREITMGDVVLGAMGMVGIIMVIAAVTGLLVGAVVIYIKRRRDAEAGPTDPGHARLRIQN
jgi:heme/copper-type cytochrome/quinol oxidase subunit 2